MPDREGVEYEVRRLRDWRHETDKVLNGLHWRVQQLERRGTVGRSVTMVLANVVIAAAAVAALILQLTHR